MNDGVRGVLGYAIATRSSCDLSHFNLLNFGTSMGLLAVDRRAFCIRDVLSGLYLLLIVFNILLFYYVLSNAPECAACWRSVAIQVFIDGASFLHLKTIKLTLQLQSVFNAFSQILSL